VAFLSQGWCDDVQAMGCQKYGFTRIHMVDMTYAGNPTVIGSVSTPVTQSEGVYVRDNYLYVGGISSTVLSVVNITVPENATVLCSGGLCQTRPYYNQMVGEMLHDGDDGSFNPSHGNEGKYRYWVAALFGTPGGAAVFDTKHANDPASPREVAHITDKRMSTGNRVHIHRGHAVIPLEQDPAGGFAVLSVADPSCPAIVGYHFLGVGSDPFSGSPVTSRVYCLVVKDDTVILFFAKTCEMIAFKLPMLAKRAVVERGDTTCLCDVPASSSQFVAEKSGNGQLPGIGMSRFAWLVISSVIWYLLQI